MSQELLLPRSSPVATGMSSIAISNFLDAVEGGDHELHSLMILRRGHVVAEGWWAPYQPDTPHMLFSLSKSFTSTAAGFAVSEGLLSLDDKVLSFFSGQAPAVVSGNLAAMRVRDLLTMTTGTEDTIGAVRMSDTVAADWVSAILAVAVEYTPGTHFAYNSGATYLVSAIVQQLTGEKVVDYLTPRLFTPLGITQTRWEECPAGFNTGGWGFSATTESVAKFGQLYLGRGIFGGRRILPEAWINEATSWQVSNGDDPNNDWSQGYGYQFWRCRHNAYRADGAFGQYCVIVPERDMVVVTTGALKDMGAVLNLVWEHLLPADQYSQGDDKAQAVLDQRLKTLELPHPLAQSTLPAAMPTSGRTYRFPANDQGVESIRVDFAGDGAAITFVAEGGTHVIRAGWGRWIDGDTALSFGVQKPFTVYPSYRIGASAAWSRAELTMRIAYTEMPFVATLTFQFSDDHLTIAVAQNIAFNQIDRPSVIGIAGAD